MATHDFRVPMAMIKSQLKTIIMFSSSNIYVWAGLDYCLALSSLEDSSFNFRTSNGRMVSE
jgi:hypothetical protein